MIDFIEYVVSELKSKRLSKANTLALIKQFSTQSVNRAKGAVIHPLLHTNTSVLSQQSYCSTFTGREFFLADHQVNIGGESGEKVLPGVAYLEMARAAVAQAMDAQPEHTCLEMDNIVWLQPFVVSEPKDINIALFSGDNEEQAGEHIAYDIFSTEADESGGLKETIHSQGRISFNHSPEPVKLDIEQLKGQMQQRNLASDRIYEAFNKMGLNYGPAHQGIISVHQGNNQLLAHLRLPDVVQKGNDEYILHPSILDSALQSTLGLSGDLQQVSSQPSLPFALELLRIINPCSKDMFAWVRYAPGSQPGSNVTKLDIDLCDKKGNVCVQMRGFSSRVLVTGTTQSQEQLHEQAKDCLLASPVWNIKDIQTASITSSLQFAQKHVMLCNVKNVKAKQLGLLLPDNQCSQMQTHNENIAENYSQLALSCFKLIRKVLNNKPKGKVLFQLVIGKGHKQTVYTGLSGLFKTAALENPLFVGQIILTEPELEIDELVGKLKDEHTQTQDVLVKYDQGNRYVLDWQDSLLSHERPHIGFKDHGVYLITGGLGGLGVLFAKEILRQTSKVKIIFTGRSALTSEKQEILNQISTQTDQLDYLQLDICDLTQVQQALKDIKKKHQQLNGIIHSAGMIVDNYILKKSSAEFSEVLAPKVTGTVILDQASKDLDLDLFVLFSSGVSALGNAGQADYASANGFLDQFSVYRQQLVVDGERQGKTLSINWPLWQNGGMQLDQSSQDAMEEVTGMLPMQTSTGMTAFYQGLAMPDAQLLVMEGNVSKMRHFLNEDTNQLEQKTPASIKVEPVLTVSVATTPVTTTNKTVAIDGEVLVEETQDYLKQQFSQLLKLAPHKIDPLASMENFGIDSILAMNLTSLLEKTFGSLPKTLFFEYQTVSELAQYFIQTFPTQLASLLETPEVSSAEVTEVLETPTKTVTQVKSTRRLNRQRHVNTSGNNAAANTTTAAINADPIAIIGLSGRYPESDNIEEYWHNLSQGKDCIVEVPKNRWDWQEYYNGETGSNGHHSSKWGGFISGVEEFDPLFFNISPREAEYIDPQERLFLQHAWMAVEDAGYTRTSLQVPHEQDQPGQVGVYAGVMYGEYNLSGSLASIANRVSYVLNLHGPSMVLDTMCSSSLTAIHLACQDLKQGRTSLAIAGGVNVSIHPSKYEMLSAGQFISSDGHCQSFGEGGDGYIPGEGVGAVILKRLSEAKRDGNHIYGLIRGSALNHGGKTNGYTVPNPLAQSSSISRALAESNTDVRHVSYIEAHGTGTKLGDPIEISALSKAFTNNDPKGLTSEMFGYCSIGSAKSNIGHCESAAGIAGLTKVLLQMKHKKIVPSLHSTELNPHIDFDKTPFVVNQTLKEWEQPVVDGQKQSRIAGLSSFGAGGSNAHMIIEEYHISKDVKSAAVVSQKNGKVIIPLSARTSVQLKQKANELLDFILNSNKRIEQEQPTSSNAIELLPLAYTLQVGREAMEERLGIMVSSIEQLTEKLQGYVGGEQDIADVYRGQLKSNKDTISLFSLDADFQETVNKWITSKKFAKLLDLWAKGLEFDWLKLYGEVKPQRISLPVYPFAKDRYWIDPVSNVQSNTTDILTSESASQKKSVIHSLLHTNTSDFSQQSYSTEFNGDEFFLTGDLSGQKLLADVVYLEMARAAIAQATPPGKETQMLQLENVFWGQPATISTKTEINIALFTNDGNPPTNENIDYEIYSQEGNEELTHCIGQARYIPQAEYSKVDLLQLKAQMMAQPVKAFANVSALYLKDTQLLAEINLSGAIEDKHQDFIIHPAMMDKTVQVAVALTEGTIEPSGQRFFPFALDSLKLISPLSKHMFVWVRLSEVNQAENNNIQLDIDLLDNQGNVCLKLFGLSLKKMSLQSATNENQISTGLQLAIPEKTFISETIISAKPQSIKLADLNATSISQNTVTAAKPQSVALISSSKIIETASQIGIQQNTISINVPEQPIVTEVHSSIKSLTNIKPEGHTPAKIRQHLTVSLAEALYMDVSEIDDDKSFVDLGLDSIVGVEWVNIINNVYGLAISATKVYDYSNINELAAYLQKELGETVVDTNPLIETVEENQQPVYSTVALEQNNVPVIESEVVYPKEQLQQELIQSLAKALYMDISEIDNDKSFIDLGLDSIVGVEWVNDINKKYGLAISATKVYDYSNIIELAGYLSKYLKTTTVSAKEAPVVKQSSVAKQTAVTSVQTSKTSAFPLVGSYPVLERRKNTGKGRQVNHAVPQHNKTVQTIENMPVRDKVAIIGMSGRYAQASNLEQYWDNLLQGKNSITEVPAARWDVEQYYDPNPMKKDKVYCKWLGALDDIDCFDPLFFQISPAEAESMDPQHRLFMQEAYKAFEDAGYSNKTLSNKKCGVYLGIMSSEYSFLQAEDNISIDTTGNSFAIGAARIAYYLNLKGPAIPLDTACSSSMVGIHLASQALLNHEIDMALTGGVSLYLTADSYLGMCQAGMLSPQGQCKAFDDSANGFVPGEGVGALVLKRLQDAEADNDNIYGVILGSGINQDGKTNGITAPSVNSQIELEREIYEKYNIDPRSISYVEAHGTGTKLGDPIELEALATVFSEKTSSKNFCALGSVKSNIGHTSGSAGIASVQKVLLSMQNKTLVPSLNVVEENSLFDFENSPFYISKEKESWDVSPETLRRSSISSFGFSGTNVHMVIEEYQAKARQAVNVNDLNAPVLIVLSARATEQLQQKVYDLLSFIEGRQKAIEINLTDMAYTLQTGREEMKERLAFAVNSVEQLMQKLSAFIAGEKNIEGVYQGQLNRNENTLALFTSDADLQDTIGNWIQRKELVKLAGLWVKGLTLDWNNFYIDSNPKRISLPTYPFAKERYWIDTKVKPAAQTHQLLPANKTVSNNELTFATSEKQKLHYFPQWKTNSLAMTEAEEQFPVLVLASTEELFLTVKKQLSERITKVLDDKLMVSVTFADSYQQLAPTTFTINPEREDDFYQLAKTLKAQGILPRNIIHQCLNTDSLNSNSSDSKEWVIESKDLDNQLNHSLYALLYLSKALMKQKHQQQVKILSFYDVKLNASAPHHAALAGFFKSLTLENPKYLTKLVEFQYGENTESVYESVDTKDGADRTDSTKSLVLEKTSLILDELQDSSSHNVEIRYQYQVLNGVQTKERYVKEFSRFNPSEIRIDNLPLKQGGVYIITGGLGGLGFIFSEYLVKNFNAKLVLLGRSALKNEQEEKLNRLMAYHSNILYLQADVSKFEDMVSVVEQTKARFSQINGVIHSAGVNRDSFILNKSKEEMSSVLAAKVYGAVNLEQATRAEELDLFVLFSSIASVTGNFGQCDYAYANHFLDSFAQEREALRKQQKCFGKTLSINWPLWEEGGMTLSDKDIALTQQQTGMQPLPTQEAIEYWQTFLQSKLSQGIALYGCSTKIQNYLSHDSNEPALMQKTVQKTVQNNIQNTIVKTFDTATLIQNTENYITGLLSAEIKLAPELIDAQEEFASFGIDSIIIGRLNAQLDRDLGELPKTLFYEYETVEELAGYLTQEAEQTLTRLFNTGSVVNESVPQAEVKQAMIKKVELNTVDTSYEVSQPTMLTSKSKECNDQIAIIGVHGRYPESSNLDEYWENLKEGKDLVNLVPANRWDREDFFHPDPEMAAHGKIYCKWGGFLNDFDKFDASFFNISPEDANNIDPQERLFLESVWSVIEDAGYTKDSLKKNFPKDKSADVGVFVGTTTNSYHLLAPEEWSRGNIVHPAALPWSIANRVSYYFDFQGPSLPVDTACSSSLVALHLACESLKKQECQLAVAGGVNLYLHPSKYQSFCQKRMISTSGKNCSFGAGDNGFVPGEGVGTLLLKPLASAIADEDHIYGVIAGSDYEHSGSSNGYSAPNPNSQASLINRTLKKANINPESISYIEGHGTGTQLGDSLEIAALTQAFEKQTMKKNFCSIGSVKANIGHSESAAGIAGVAKILLQMKHRQLAPSINSAEINPNIDFDNSPFYLQRELSVWPSSELHPRRAVINSFGAGGVNSCVILEEYEQVVAQKVQEDTPYLVILSAKNAVRLQAVVNDLLNYLTKENVDLANLCYTLQVGRESMSDRLALIASDMPELINKLRSWHKQELTADLNEGDHFRSSLSARRSKKSSTYDDNQIDAIFAARNLSQLATAWVQGDELDWQKLYADNKPSRISLPGYSFAKERHWVTDNLVPHKNSIVSQQSTKLHPLISHNVSTLKTVSFTSLLEEQAYYAQDHKVNGESIFPGAGFIEIGCIAGSIAGECKISKIKDIVWAQPLSFQNGNRTVQTFLKSIGNSTNFEVTSLDDENERVVHSEGRLFFEADDKCSVELEENLPVQAYKEKCSVHQEGDVFYQQFEVQGLIYGPAFRPVQEIYLNDTYALAKLTIHDNLKTEFDDYMLHPSIIDGALQAVVGLIGHTESTTAYLPFALDEITLIRPLTQTCYAYVQTADSDQNSAMGIKKFNIRLLNERGELLMKLTNFYVRAIQEVKTTKSDSIFNDEIMEV